MQTIRLNLKDYHTFKQSGRNSLNWRIAWQNTKKSITENLSDAMQVEIENIRDTLVKYRKESACKWCDGAGKVNDHINYTDKQIICFFCAGSGIKFDAEPVFFRRKVVDTVLSLLKYNCIEKVEDWAKKVEEASIEEQPYRPILMDIVFLIEHKEYDKIKKIPH